MTRTASPWVGAIALMALAGCGGHDAKASAAENDGPAAEGSTASAPAATTASDATIDACELLTKADATTLFGQPAVSQEPEMGPLPDQIGACQWGWVGAEQTQQVWLKIMTSPDDHYYAIDSAKPLDLGDKSQLVIDETTLSMDVDWVQGDRFFDLHYTASPYQAFDQTKAGPVESLAREISGRL